MLQWSLLLHRSVLTKLRAKHAETPNSTFGINGNTGDIVDMQELGVWEPYAVKVRRLIQLTRVPVLRLMCGHNDCYMSSIAEPALLT